MAFNETLRKKTTLEIRPKYQQLQELPSNKALFTMSSIALRVRDKRLLVDTNWCVNLGENWVVLGPNGAGKTTLMHAITGQAPVVAGNITRHHPMAFPDAVGYVSFELEQRRIDRERLRDEARIFSGRSDDLLRVANIVLENHFHHTRQTTYNIDTVTQALDIKHLMDREVRQLSSGELRRTFIARALLKSNGLLILDEPFEGLDSHHRGQLSTILNDLMDRGFQLILVTHRFDEIPHKMKHAIAVKQGRVFAQGLCKEILVPRFIDDLYGKSMKWVSSHKKEFSSGQSLHDSSDPEAVIDIRKAKIRYGAVTVFANLTWRMKKGENWVIYGANGSGKTSLLRMITGDHLQAYANEIYLFGNRRGSGESIWDIKKRFGVVSAELQRQYRKRMPALNVILSGFFDSIGLYRPCTKQQKDRANKWIHHLNLGELIKRRYDHLSFGERKMVLIARAVVKSPDILILDEPCQGLDRTNRYRVLNLINRIGQTTATQLIFVTHRPEEIPACITHFFKMPSGSKNSVKSE